MSVNELFTRVSVVSSSGPGLFYRNVCFLGTFDPLVKKFRRHLLELAILAVKDTFRDTVFGFILFIFF